ncbi:MAG: hypothetical protein HUU38_27160 [Anaerolineales bacterium]|nr:hypothetical protein [Anaerolineales bacterium]
MHLPRAPFLLFTFSLLLTLTACRPDPNDQFIQGTWQLAETDADNRFFEWRFDNGTFIRQQEIDSVTTLYTTGQYRIIESEGDALTLELFDYSGDRIAYENTPITLPIEIDRDNDTARIQNTGFVRISP